jgi:general secretion pathway protein G
MPSPNKQSGGTLLELAVVGAVIGILATIFLGYVLRYQEVAEKTVMETTVINMRTGLRWRTAELLVQDRARDLAIVAQENPINWLAAAPSNYLGQLDNPAPASLPRGSWYYDNTRRQLVYLPDRSRRLKPGPDGEKIIRFHVTAKTHPGENGAPARVEGVTLSPVIPYDWPVF